MGPCCGLIAVSPLMNGILVGNPCWGYRGLHDLSMALAEFEQVRFGGDMCGIIDKI